MANKIIQGSSLYSMLSGHDGNFQYHHGISAMPKYSKYTYIIAIVAMKNKKFFSALAVS